MRGRLMEKNLIKEVGHLDHCIKKYMSGTHEPQKYVNFTQLQIVFYLLKHRDQDICQKDLEKETSLKKASITASLNSLEEKGLVCREVSKEDRRKNYIRISKKLEKYTRDYEKKLLEFNRTILRGIPEEDLETFFSVIDRVYANIRGESDETDI